jgi:septal ring factor EnvC (AmiA/AmiB activator)
MMPSNWFQRKWGLDDPIITDELYQRVVDLEEKVRTLKEENIETNNILYELMNSIEALDARIDILKEEPKDV